MTCSSTYVAQPSPSSADDTIDYFIETTFNVPTLCEAYKYAAYDGLQRWQETSHLTRLRDR